MINRRILIFGIIAILGITAIKLGTDLVKENILGTGNEDLEIVRSDENIQVLEEEDMRKTVFYFKNKDGFLVPVMKKIPWSEGIAKATLANMVDTSELRESLKEKGLLPIIPEGTRIHGISIDEETGLCKVDFSEEFLNSESKEDEENLIKGIVYTLTEFPKIKEVELVVEGKKLPKLKHNTDISKSIRREDINLVGNLEGSRSKILVYFKDDSLDEFEYYIPVTVPTMAPMPNVYTALDVLFDGPPKELSLKTDVPVNLNLEGVEIKEGTAFIDIKSSEKDSIKGANLNLLMKNIGLTLSQFDEIENIEILVDGKIVNTAVPVFANEY